jgi:hypothetical protein
MLYDVPDERPVNVYDVPVVYATTTPFTFIPYSPAHADAGQENDNEESVIAPPDTAVGRLKLTDLDTTALSASRNKPPSRNNARYCNTPASGCDTVDDHAPSVTATADPMFVHVWLENLRYCNWMVPAVTTDEDSTTPVTATLCEHTPPGTFVIVTITFWVSGHTR